MKNLILPIVLFLCIATSLGLSIGALLRPVPEYGRGMNVLHERTDSVERKAAQMVRLLDSLQTEYRSVTERLDSLRTAANKSEQRFAHYERELKELKNQRPTNYKDSTDTDILDYLPD